MAKIAAALAEALAHRVASGSVRPPESRQIAAGDGWLVEDVLCTAGPGDRSYEEQHSLVRIAVVVAGSFQYRAECRHTIARELMTPGSVLLATQGQCFQCGHDHDAGDRCLSFGYTPEYFESLTGAAVGRGTFDAVRLPPLRHLSALIARGCAGMTGDAAVDWDAMSVELGAQATQLANQRASTGAELPSGAAARVTQIVRRIERAPDAALTLRELARDAALSPYHFLRTFERLTGVTPHQYILRTRLREAATRLIAEPGKVLDIALDCGFGDVSNFNRAFRAEFGASPREYRSSRRFATKARNHETD